MLKTKTSSSNARAITAATQQQQLAWCYAHRKHRKTTKHKLPISKVFLNYRHFLSSLLALHLVSFAFLRIHNIIAPTKVKPTRYIGQNDNANSARYTNISGRQKKNLQASLSAAHRTPLVLCRRRRSVFLFWLIFRHSLPLSNFNRRKSQFTLFKHMVRCIIIHTNENERSALQWTGRGSAR